MTAQQSSWTPRKVLIVVLLLALLSSGVTLAQAWRHRAPYGPEALRPHASVTAYTDAAAAQHVVDALFGPDRYVVPIDRPDAQFVIGTLSFDGPPQARDDDVHVLFVLDAFGRPVHDIMGLTSRGDAVSVGWDGRYGQLADRYRWLSHLRSVETDQGWTDPGDSLSWRATMPGPVTFVAVVPDAGRAAGTGGATFALALLGNDRMQWATRIIPGGQPTMRDSRS
jgi:hypothetical protein